MRLRILHTNDIHSRFENYANIVSRIRELRDDNTIILDAGDFNDFMRLELIGTKGRAGIELLDSAGYDAITIGNNETFQGIDMLAGMASNDMVPFLSCNIGRIEHTPIEGVKRSVIIDRAGLRILIIGASPQLKVFYEMSGIELLNYKEEISKELSDNKGRYDISILLSHLGLKEDRVIAETIAGIDIIIDGHSHVLMKEPEVIRNTIIHQSGSFGEHLGVLDVEYDGKITGFKGENISMEGIARDKVIMDVIGRNKEISIDILDVPIYYIDRDLWHDVVEENPMTNLLADALMDMLNCDLALINSGVINGGIRKGPVSEKKLLEICPSPLNPTTFEIEGKYLRQALQSSMYSDFCMQDGIGSGFRGRYLGRLHVSGAVIEHDGRRIKRILIGGNELQDDRVYIIGSSDYLQRGTGYESLASCKLIKYNPEYLRDTLRDYLGKLEYLERAFVDRWIKI